MQETMLQIRGIFILKNKWNNKHFHFSSHIWPTNVIMKRSTTKHVKLTKKKKNITTIWYYKYYLICTSVIVHYNYCYRQKAKKLKTAAEETMAKCAKYSPQVHKLRKRSSEQNVARQKSTASVGKSLSREDRQQMYKLRGSGDNTI